MQHNLTDNQLEALRWIVQRVKSGKLKENFLAIIEYSHEILFPSIKTIAPEYVNSGALNALVVAGVLHLEKVSGIQNRYSLTRTAYEIADFDFANPDPDPERSYIKETHRLIQKHFNPDELNQVCFELGVNDWAFGDNRDRPFELLLYLYRQSRLEELTPILQEQRPAVDWPEYPADED